MRYCYRVAASDGSLDAEVTAGPRAKGLARAVAWAAAEVRPGVHVRVYRGRLEAPPPPALDQGPAVVTTEMLQKRWIYDQIPCLEYVANQTGVNLVRGSQ